MFNDIFKNLFLRTSGDRLKWLSEQKSGYVKVLLDHLRSQRTLTFCNGIPQTEELGKYCINSKNKASEENLHKFNEGKVDHITACNMLDEGMNLTNCRVGVYAVLNSSDRMIKQKLGRLLRHPDPIIVIPYFQGTREEEIVGTMLTDYNPKLVTKITSLTELKL
jgi:superfamily II DNA or RNA helicase